MRIVTAGDCLQAQTRVRALTTAPQCIGSPPLNGGGLLRFTAPHLHFAAARGPVFAGDFAFPSVVGYQNKGFDANFNYVANTFVPVGVDRDKMTLGDIVPNDGFKDSSIQFLTPGGATASDASALAFST